VDAYICTAISHETKIRYLIRMAANAKLFTVLGWVAMASLALAIARQLSEQKRVYSGVPNSGTPL
jgi:hypothetical protein